MAFGSILIFEIPICREYQITLDCYTIGMFKSLCMHGDATKLKVVSVSLIG
jgi:hypothetical protein